MNNNTYQHFVTQCDSLENASSSWPAACMFLTVYALGVLLQLCILPANMRLARNRSAFLLLLHINLFDLVWLFQYIWLCVEFLSGKRLNLPWNAEAYLFRVVNFCIDAFYIELAMNRAMAVMDGSGKLYEDIFNQKNTKVYICCTWLMGIVYSIYVNWFPARRPFHCLTQLGYFEPIASIPKHLFVSLPDSAFYDGIQQIYMFCIYIPVLIYIAAFAKLFYKFMKRTIFCMNNSLMHAKGYGTCTTNKMDNTNVQFANLALERSRLFLLCFFSQLPYLLANGLYHLSRQVQLDQQTVQVMAFFWQLFGTVFHVQQPVLMLLLSRDMRQGVREDFSRLMVAFKRTRNFRAR